MYYVNASILLDVNSFGIPNWTVRSCLIGKIIVPISIHIQSLLMYRFRISLKDVTKTSVTIKVYMFEGVP